MDILNDKGFYNTDGEFGKQIVQDLILPDTHTDPIAVSCYNRFAQRIHWVDDNIMPGAFQINTSWYTKPNTFFLESDPSEGRLGFMKSHVHDVDEFIAFYGTDPEHPYDLNGEVIFYINNEKHIITKSSLIYMPAGMPHSPLIITKVDKPIFHFSIVMQSKYALQNEDGYQEAK